MLGHYEEFRSLNHIASIPQFPRCLGFDRFETFASDTNGVIRAKHSRHSSLCCGTRREPRTPTGAGTCNSQ